MIKLFPIRNMEYAPFARDWGKEFLANRGIVLTDSEDDCDIYLTNYFPVISKRHMMKFHLLHWKRPRPVLVWTHEPRYCSSSLSKISALCCPKWYIMNVYNRNVFISNYSWYGEYNIVSRIDLVDEATLSDFPAKPIAAVATYVNNTGARLIKEGKDIDLSAKRQELIIAGFHTGMVDIYGKGWPEDMQVGSLTFGKSDNTWNFKIECLKKYHFNICMENTDFDYYVSEKIWNSIRAKCLPIYRGGGERIYEDFPRNSFIDYSDFSDAEAILDYIKNMSKEEYCVRLNRCITTYNEIFERNDFQQQREATLELIVNQIQEIAR